ncbi:hypothetical protein F4809DRAFT_638885 [Biscogniauxia mediterranea]|nr:hypothetical protein F4809DRAFT_638885 [Biscogniauxia mediterranea]
MSSQPTTEKASKKAVTEIHTKAGHPRTMMAELRKMITDQEFKVEIRHDVYHIICETKFDDEWVRTLWDNCKKREATEGIPEPVEPEKKKK